jgi:tRNA threonylcarbamoyladenosine biosynthesis protein TsaE
LHDPVAVDPTPLHADILGSRTVHWPDEAACAAFAAGLAARIAASPAARQGTVGLTLELAGPLGAGKTTFARHLLRALGVTGRVRSPTYALVETYDAAGMAVAHLDFYRFADPHEWEDAGLREVFGAPGLKLVEWPEKAAGLLPPPDLRLAIEPRDDASRRVRCDAFTPAGAELIR